MSHCYPLHHTFAHLSALQQSGNGIKPVSQARGIPSRGASSRARRRSSPSTSSSRCTGIGGCTSSVGSSACRGGARTQFRKTRVAAITLRTIPDASCIDHRLLWCRWCCLFTGNISLCVARGTKKKKKRIP